jgi:predicted DNA-binding transcriptional regulator AlpA
VSGENRIAKKEVTPRKNRITKKKKGIVTVGADKDRAQSLTPGRSHAAPGHGPSARGPPLPDAAYIDAPQLLARFGGRSHMWLVRLLERDQSFPRPVKIGRLRFFKIDDLIAWERQTAVKSRVA